MADKDESNQNEYQESTTERYKPRYTSLLDWKMTDEQLRRRDEMMAKAFEVAFEESEVKPNEPRQSNGAP